MVFGKEVVVGVVALFDRRRAIVVEVVAELFGLLPTYFVEM